MHTGKQESSKVYGAVIGMTILVITIVLSIALGVWELGRGGQHPESSIVFFGVATTAAAILTRHLWRRYYVNRRG